MSDDGAYSSDDDGHIGADMDPVMDPTLTVDVGSGLTVRSRRTRASEVTPIATTKSDRRPRRPTLDIN
jgi:hypothetical protein